MKKRERKYHWLRSIFKTEKFYRRRVIKIPPISAYPLKEAYPEMNQDDIKDINIFKQ